MGKIRILAVDDDLPQLTIIQMILKKEGFEVFLAHDGEEGLHKARALKPDLVITDVMMPKLDGFEFTEKLRADPDTSQIAVLILSAKGGVEKETRESWRFANRVVDRIKGYDSGAIEFLTKPVKAKDLVQRVKAVLWASGYDLAF